MKFNKNFLIYYLILLLLTSCTLKQKNNFLIPFSITKTYKKKNIKIIWKNTIKHGIEKYYSKLSPIYDNSIIYAASRKGIIQAIDISSGKILWITNLLKNLNSMIIKPFPILLSSGLTIADNTIYMGTETGKVIALNKFYGYVLWEANVYGEVLAQPVISKNLVLIHTNNGLLYALDTETGQKQWNINLGTSPISIRGTSSPVIMNNIAIIGDNSGRLNAILIDQGKIIWKTYIAQIYGSNQINWLHDINITPLIDVNLKILYAIAYNGNLVAINMYSGDIIWKRNIGSINNMILNHNIIYLIDQYNYIIAINTINGSTIWKQKTLTYKNLTAPNIYNNCLVFGDDNGYLYWLNINNGDLVFKYKIDDSGFLNYPIIANDTLLIQSKKGTVYLIK